MSDRDGRVNSCFGRIDILDDGLLSALFGCGSAASCYAAAGDAAFLA